MTLPEIHLIGISLEQKTTNQNNQSTRDIGELWQKFVDENVLYRVTDRLSNDIYAVYYDFEGDHARRFSYFVGAKVEPATLPPKGLQSLKIPVQKYQKFLAKGKMPMCIGETWREIWKSGIKRAFGFDFEVLDERSHNWQNAELDIFVSVP